MIERIPSTPKLIELVVVVFALLAGLGSASSFWNGELFWSGSIDPFSSYNSNGGIRLLHALALLTDITFLIVYVFWRRPQSKAAAWQACFAILCLIGTMLAWTELWYGSTFYYGEVRDKQGLPVGVNNGGVVGSFVFLSYLVIRGVNLSLPKAVAWIGSIVGLVALWFGHKAVLSLVEAPWKLWQS